MKTKHLAWLALALILAEMVLVLLSWLLAATMTEGVRSLLSSEGIRWFFGSFVSQQASPWLVWLLLLSMSVGNLSQSGLLSRTVASGYRRRMAVGLSVGVLVVYVGVVLALTLLPHAQLLSATGRLFPSAFSRALVPIVTFGILLSSTVYGWASGRFATFADVFRSMAYGVQAAAPLFVLYVLIVQFVQSLHFVFM